MLVKVTCLPCFCSVGTIGIAFWDKVFYWNCCSPVGLLSPKICLSMPLQCWNYWHMAWHLVLNFAQQILYYWAVFLVPACGITYLSRVTLHCISHIIIHGSLLFHKTLLVQANIAWLLLISSDYLWMYVLIVWRESKFW